MVRAFSEMAGLLASEFTFSRSLIQAVMENTINTSAVIFLMLIILFPGPMIPEGEIYLIKYISNSVSEVLSIQCRQFRLDALSISGAGKNGVISLYILP